MNELMIVLLFVVCLGSAFGLGAVMGLWVVKRDLDARAGGERK